MIKEAIKYLSPDEINVVIYHKNCSDGLASALCVYEKLGDSVEYIPMHYNDKLDFEKLKDKNVLIVDFSFDKETLEKIRTFSKKAMIIDHHISAIEKLEGVEGCFFDVSHSAAYLCFIYMNVNDPADYNYQLYQSDNWIVPRFILYIEDRDIWKWEFREKSGPFSYGLKELNFSDKTFKLFKKYLRDEEEVEELVKIGKNIMEKNNLFVNNSIKNAKKVDYRIFDKNYKIMLLALENPKLISEISEKLYTENDVDFTLCWFPDRNNKFLDLRLFKILYGEQKYILSFRTNKKKIDVSKIASSVGGGGHKEAAGATIKYHPNDLIINNFVIKIFLRIANNLFK
jgi:oligoribonuclease NrnB/cAMP/cGMP phosphodiesterase (DHH superfamily)